MEVAGVVEHYPEIPQMCRKRASPGLSVRGSGFQTREKSREGRLKARLFSVVPAG
jgi:hypothetical protein